jgi:hypothetical protein
MYSTQLYPSLYCDLGILYMRRMFKYQTPCGPTLNSDAADTSSCCTGPALACSAIIPGIKEQLSAPAVSRILQDIYQSQAIPARGEYHHLITVGYNNLPSFLREFCFLRYHKQMSLQQVAATLQISEHLAQQRWIVSIALFRILLAAKPKNPV